jgi:type I restriction enzyme S subunit
MELKPGYKQTEVGVIPEDWNVRTLNDIAEVKGGKRLPLGKRLTDTVTPHPYIRVTDMYYGGINLDEIRFVPEDVFPAIKNYRISSEDIFISVAGTLGIVGKIPPELDGANLTENADKITSIRCDRDFLLYNLMSQRIQNIIESEKTVGAQPKLALSRIKGFTLALPSDLSEQRAIAAVLSDVDALIAKLEALIAKKRNIQQAAMQQLLTGKTRLPGFSGEWEVKRLRDIGTTYSGLSGKTKADFGSGSAKYIPFLNVISNVVVDPTNLEMVRVDASEGQNQVQKGDLFFNGSSETPEEVGMCAVLLDDLQNVYLNSFCFGFRLHEGVGVNGLYLAYFFRSGQGRALLYSLAQGATRYNLSKREFLNLEIPSPDFEEQSAIAEVLSDMDAEIAALEARLEKTRALKQGMMQELLTGRIRLV